MHTHTAGEKTRTNFSWRTNLFGIIGSTAGARSALRVGCRLRGSGKNGFHAHFGGLFYIALFEWEQIAADSPYPLACTRREHSQARAWSEDAGGTLIVSSSMNLIFGQARWKRFEASLARKSRPCSSVRAFPPHRLPAAPSLCCKGCARQRQPCHGGCSLWLEL